MIQQCVQGLGKTSASFAYLASLCISFSNTHFVTHFVNAFVGQTELKVFAKFKTELETELKTTKLCLNCEKVCPKAQHVLKPSSNAG